jgi:hypothetical protein
MSVIDKIKSVFSGGSSAAEDDHSGHDHAGHDHSHEPAAPAEPEPAAAADEETPA